MKKIFLLCCGFWATLTINAQTVIYTQDFETTPAGWVQDALNTGSGFVQGSYTARSSANFPIPAPASGTGVIAVNDEQCACSSDDAIFSQNMDVTGYDSIRITFKSFYRNTGGGEEAYILVNNSGTHGSWADYDAYALPVSTTAWSNLYVTIPAADLTANFHIGFYFFDNSTASRGLAIDDVQIIGYSSVAPANDNCSGAISLTSSATCTPTTGTIAGATASGLPQACTGGTPSADVWYSFQATSEIATIAAQSATATTAGGFDLVLELYEGTCSGLSFIGCADSDDITQPGATGQENINIEGLTIGNTYYVRVYNYFGTSAVNANFAICVEERPSCSLTQPAGSIVENETCGATSNNTCATGMNITCGDTIWGSYSASGGTRDLDFYKFTINNPTTVNFTLETEFTGLIILYNAANCASPVFLNGSYVDGCDEFTLTHNITAAGTYAVVVMPDGFFSPGCAGNNTNYILSYTTNTTAPVLSAGGATTFCPGGSVELTTTGTGTIAWYNGTTLIAGATGTSYTATATGSYTSVVTDGNGCPSASNAIDVSVSPLDDASFNYASSTICEGGANVSPASVATTGGTFSSTVGLIFADASTGEIDVAGSTAGTYVVTYTTAGACPEQSTQTITITSAPDASFSYAATDYCTAGTNPSPVVTGTIGAFSSTPAGLSVNATTGVITLSTSTAGTYDVTNTIAASGSCPAASETVQVTITEAGDASFAYAASSYCLSGSNPTPAVTGTAGTFSSTPAGLSINAATGEIDLANSTPGVYTVTNELPASGACPVITETAQVTVTANPDAAFSYAETSYCSTGTATPTITGAAGTFTASPAGLSINASTGVIDLAASTAGTYTITNTIAATATCGEETETFTVTVEEVPTATVTLSGITLTAQETGVTYQWIDCAGNTPVAGATSQTFTPSAPGSYAVIITDGNCSATSSCQAVSNVGIEDNSIEMIAVYPSPADQTITISGLTASNATVSILDVNGRVLVSQQTSSAKLEMSVRDFESGVYLIKVESETINGTKRFIRK